MEGVSRDTLYPPLERRVWQTMALNEWGGNSAAAKVLDVGKGNTPFYTDDVMLFNESYCHSQNLAMYEALVILELSFLSEEAARIREAVEKARSIATFVSTLSVKEVSSESYSSDAWPHGSVHQ